MVKHEFMLTRAGIIKHLREQCEAVYSDKITFVDECSLVGGNLVTGTILFFTHSE